jgi:hypothetical protein
MYNASRYLENFLDIFNSILANFLILFYSFRYMKILSYF